MKSSLVAASIFAALLLLGSPASAQFPPSETEVNNAINQWISDVNQLNVFLNQAAAGTLPDVASSAASAKQTALDEPVQLSILNSIPSLSDQATSAANVISTVSGNVPADLQGIVDNPSASNVETQLGSINNVRCLQVLPSLDILWPAAAAAVGAPAPQQAGLPKACIGLTPGTG